MAQDPTKPDYMTLPPAQWAELMGKFDAIAAAISGLTLSVPPANLTPIIERLDLLTAEVKALSFINLVRDVNGERIDIFGRFKEST